MTGSTPGICSGAGLLRNHVVKLPVDHNMKPVVEPPRRMAYCLKSRVDEVIISDVKTQDIIEEYPESERATWVSNIAIALKDNGNLSMTLDPKSVNRGLSSPNYSIPFFAGFY